MSGLPSCHPASYVSSTVLIYVSPLAPLQVLSIGRSCKGVASDNVASFIALISTHCEPSLLILSMYSGSSPAAHMFAHSETGPAFYCFLLSQGRILNSGGARVWIKGSLFPISHSFECRVDLRLSPSIAVSIHPWLPNEAWIRRQTSFLPKTSRKVENTPKGDYWTWLLSLCQILQTGGRVPTDDDCCSRGVLCAESHTIPKFFLLS